MASYATAKDGTTWKKVLRLEQMVSFSIPAPQLTFFFAKAAVKTSSSLDLFLFLPVNNKTEDLIAYSTPAAVLCIKTKVHSLEIYSL